MTKITINIEFWFRRLFNVDLTSIQHVVIPGGGSLHTLAWMLRALKNAKKRQIQ
jgi:hypothetical protein